MAKKWTYFTTNYREAWNAYRKSAAYAATMEVLKSKGIDQPYRDNMLKAAFAAGWNATKAEIKSL